MKKTLILFFILLLFLPIFSSSNQWGNLDLIYYFNSIGQKDKVIKNIDIIDLKKLSGNERERLTEKLLDFADGLIKKDKEMAKKIYKKVINEVPDYWFVANKIYKIENKEKNIFFDFKGAFSQMAKLSKNFNSSFVMLSFFINSLLYTIMFVIFIFSIVMLFKYFTLFANDLLINPSGDISLKKIFFIVAMFIWPLVFFFGWSIYPFLIFGVLFKYLSKMEKRSVFILFGIATVVLLIFSLKSVLDEQYVSESFNTDRKLYSGIYISDDFIFLNNEQKMINAFSEYKKRNFMNAKEILNSADDDYRSELRAILLGNLYYKKYKNPNTSEEGDITQSIQYFLDALKVNDKNSVSLNNFALALSANRNGDDEDEKVFKSYSKRYPELNKIKHSVLTLMDPVLDKYYLWQRLISLSKTSFDPVNLTKLVFIKFLLFPFIYFLLLFYLYIKFLPKLLLSLGESTACSKCSKIIKKKSLHKSYRLCEDCHQLFLIKDVIFLEAKLLKEKEIKKNNFKGFIKIVFFSILIPGLNLNYKNKNTLFLVFSMLFYFFLIFGFSGFVGFNFLKLPVPFVFNISGMIAAVLYLILNIFSVRGEDYGI